MYVFASVRARVFAFDCPAPAGGTGLGGQATPKIGFPPSSLLSSLFFPLFSSFLPPAASGARHLPPGPQPAGEAVLAAPAADLVLSRVLAMEPRRGGQRGRERGKTGCCHRVRV